MYEYKTRTSMKIIQLLTITVFLSFPINLLATPKEEVVQLNTLSGVIEGSLLIPDGSNNIPIALIISGSGPTDRDGNNPRMKNNSLKMLAAELEKNEIASLRFDKRGVGKSKEAGGKEEDLRFENYISDAISWISLLSKDKRFSEIIVIGHSEGSLIGMIASQQQKVAKFVSIAGSGQSADQMIRKQLSSQPAAVQNLANPIIDKLVQGEPVDDVNPMLYSLFRPSVQPYMISWFKYDPCKEISKLKIPVLIIEGSTDLQVAEEDADMLANSLKSSRKVIIDGMNHVLKDAPKDKTANLKTYTNPDLPINQMLVTVITDFIKK